MLYGLYVCMLKLLDRNADAEEKAANSGMKPSVFPKEHDILKDPKGECFMICMAVSKLYGLPVSINLSILPVYSSCLLLFQILASETSCG